MNTSIEHRLLHRYIGSNTPASRPVIAGRQFLSDLTEGIDGEDIPTEVIRGVRNVGVATWRATNQIIPTIVEAFDFYRQKYVLQDRTNETFAGTRASVDKIRESIRDRSIPRILSTTLSESLDGPVNDIGHGVLGAPNTEIKPV